MSKHLQDDKHQDQEVKQLFQELEERNKVQIRQEVCLLLDLSDICAPPAVAKEMLPIFKIPAKTESIS